MGRAVFGNRAARLLLAAALVALSACAWAANSLGIPDTEYNALVALYNSTNGPGWMFRDNWLTDSAPWYGVTIGGGHVIFLDFDGNQLSGAIPSEIGDFGSLQSLGLGGNRLSGTIPSSLANLVNLYQLSLGSNQLSGPIPSWIGSLTKLQDLELQYNQFSGPIPLELGNLASLSDLSLAGNQLSGTIPSQIGNFSKLQNLDLGNNQLSGTIPSEMGSLTALEWLHLTNNRLTGTIPSQLANIPNLMDLDLAANQLSGTIPSQLGNLTNLLALNFFNNQLSGPIPPELGSLTKLQYLDLGSNHLSGTIPTQIGNLMNLWFMSLYKNQLSGTMPSELGDLANLQYLYLSSNQLVGDIPHSIASLGGYIDVSYNGLWSTDPAVLAFMDADYPNWQKTETVPPTGVSAWSFGGSGVVSWTPIAYLNDYGYYQVGISQTSGGPYTFSAQNQTYRKTDSSVSVTGFAAGVNYVVVRTVTLASSHNQNTVTSAPSPEVLVTAATNVLGIPDSEYSALVALYDSTNGPGWSRQDNWFTNTTPWFGVDVEAGHVTSLFLGFNSLTGTIPSDIGRMTYLQTLTLSDNQLTGAIPSEIGNCANLQGLFLSGNQLTGDILSGIGNFTNLLSLYLDNNQLSGAIPSGIGNCINLRYMHLQGNNLTGSMPTGIGNLTHLWDMLLQGNQLSGSIPSGIGNLTNLYYLHLSNNRLSGSIPPEMDALVKLDEMYLDHNQLSGAIPPELGNCTGLEYLELQDNQLSGTIPTELGSHGGPRVLDLENNQLTGTIPSNISSFIGLQGLILNNNQLSGTIPSQIGDMNNLSDLELKNNQLSGIIPPEMGLMNLQTLDLGFNQLTGIIPPQLGSDELLQHLYLNNNQLSGPIPPELFDPPNIFELDLSFNHLSGAIPSELGTQSNMNLLNLRSNQLVGDLPSLMVRMVSLSSAANSVSYNGLSSTDPSVLAFMAAEFPDWQNTQTVAPAGVTVSGLGSANAMVSWTPIAYTSDGGYYEVGFSQTSGGPYTFDAHNRTTSKSDSHLTATGLASGANYIVMRTVTSANPNNQNVVTSLTSPEVRVVTGVNKSFADGASVEVGGVLTAAFDGFFYVESPDRSCGIGVAWDGADMGTGTLDVSGVLRTNAAGERYIDASSVTALGPGSVSPLGIPNAALGGGDSLYNSATGAGQHGVWGQKGLNNIGLLVKTWGAVTASGRGWFYVDDGSGVTDGSGNRGVYVEAEGRNLPVGARVSVIGISGCGEYQGNVVNTLLATSVTIVRVGELE